MRSSSVIVDLLKKKKNVSACLMQAFIWGLWEHFSKWWRWSHDGHLLSGTVFIFCELPLPFILKGSQLDLDQVNTQDGVKVLCYTPLRSPFSCGHCVLWHCPVEKPVMTTETSALSHKGCFLQHLDITSGHLTPSSFLDSILLFLSLSAFPFRGCQSKSSVSIYS